MFLRRLSSNPPGDSASPPSPAEAEVTEVPPLLPELGPAPGVLCGSPEAEALVVRPEGPAPEVAEDEALTPIFDDEMDGRLPLAEVDDVEDVARPLPVGCPCVLLVLPDLSTGPPPPPELGPIVVALVVGTGDG